MDDIRIDVGLYTHFVIDCSQVDFTGIEKLIFTVKNSTGLKDPPVIRREFTAGGGGAAGCVYYPGGINPGEKQRVLGRGQGPYQRTAV